MQGAAVKHGADKEVLERRRLRRREQADEKKALGKQRHRIKARLAEGRDWPMDSQTGDRAEVDPEDVMAPLPEDMRAPVGDIDEAMHKLREEADRHESFAGEVVPIDENLLRARQDERRRERELRESVRGPKWTEDLVEARINEAFRTLFRASAGGVGPREYGNAMPHVIRGMSDLVAQAGNKSLRRAAQRLLRGGGPPDREEIRRADEALGWAIDYLRAENPDLAMFVNLGGMWKAWGAKVTRKCGEIGVHRQVFYRDRKAAVRMIVAGLIKDGKAPT